MPSGASPIEVFINIRLNEPLRNEPQIANTLAIAKSCRLKWSWNDSSPTAPAAGAGRERRRSGS
jgi:hypothetical protein